MSTETEGTVGDEVPEKKGKHRGEGSGVLSDSTANFVIYVVTGIWAGSVVAGMFEINGYEPPNQIHAIFMTIVGGAFAVRARSRGGDS